MGSFHLNIRSLLADRDLRGELLIIDLAASHDYMRLYSSFAVVGGLSD